MEATSEGINSLLAVMATKEQQEIKKDKCDAEMQWQTQQLELLKSGVMLPTSEKEIKASLMERNRIKRKVLAVNQNNYNINVDDSDTE